jgi:hypothetical protein
MRLFVTTLAGLVLGCTCVFGADHTNLEEGLPVRVEDAYPIGYLGRELQLLTRYERDHEGNHSIRIEPRLELGFPRNAQIALKAPFLFGEDQPDGIGDTEAEILYNFNQETLDLPALSLAAGATLPTGDGRGIDPMIKLLATRTLGESTMFHQLHLNVRYQYNARQRDEERRDLWFYGIGYSARVTTDMMFVASIFREHHAERHVEINVVEAGIRYQLTPLWVLTGGLGFGLGDESPDVQVTFGFQYAF